MADNSPTNPFEKVPLELRQSTNGWSVVCFDGRGYAKHLAAVESEIQAYRTARRMAEIYELEGDALVVAGPHRFYYGINRLLKIGR